MSIKIIEVIIEIYEKAFNNYSNDRNNSTNL